MEENGVVYAYFKKSFHIFHGMKSLKYGSFLSNLFSYSEALNIIRSNHHQSYRLNFDGKFVILTLF